VRKVEIACPEARLSVLSDRNIIPPSGVNGGRSGAPNRFEVLRDGKPIPVSAFPGKVTSFPLRRGDVVVMQSSGGGGFGPAAERDLALIVDDFADGLVSAPSLATYGARDTSGVVERGMTDLLDEASASIEWRNDDAPSHECVVSAALAQHLGLTQGSSIELAMAKGPSLRAWVDRIEAGKAATIYLSPNLRRFFAGSTVTVRSLGSQRPINAGVRP
jgi:hypothetical protein